MFFFCSRIFSDVVWHTGISIAGQLIVSASPHFTLVEIGTYHREGRVNSLFYQLSVLHFRGLSRNLLDKSQRPSFSPVFVSVVSND